MDELISVPVVITLVAMMVAIGSGVTFAQLLEPVRDWRMMTRAAGANYPAVPALTVALLPLLLLFTAGSAADGAGVPAIDAADVVRAPLITQLLPLVTGVAVRARWPALAARLQKPANDASAVLGISLLVMIPWYNSIRCGRLTHVGSAGCSCSCPARLPSAGWRAAPARTTARRWRW